MNESLFYLKATTGSECVTKVRLLLKDALESLDNDDAVYCADCIDHAHETMNKLFTSTDWSDHE